MGESRVSPWNRAHLREGESSFTAKPCNLGSPGKGRAEQEGKARQTAGKGAEATSEALENVWIDNESRWALCIQQAADLFSRSLFSAGPGIEAKGELRSEPWEGASRARGQSALARALQYQE
jgi:hypothetical protein